jgi:hypothetical protein
MDASSPQTLATMRGSFLGAVNGEPEASARLRMSLTQALRPGNAPPQERSLSRRTSNASMTYRRASLQSGDGLSRSMASRRGSMNSRRGSCGIAGASMSASVSNGPGNVGGEARQGPESCEEINEMLLRCLERRTSYASRDAPLNSEADPLRAAEHVRLTSIDM